MNVLLVMTAREVGGAELYVEQLVVALVGRCHFTVALSDQRALSDLANRLSLVANVVRLPFDSPLHLPVTLRRLARLAATHDVIHLNSNHPASRLGILMGFVLPTFGKPVIAVEQRATPMSDVRVPGAISWVLPVLFRWSRHEIASVIAVSRENKRTLIEHYGLPTGKIAVVYNGVDLSRFSQPDAPLRSLRAELGCTDDQPIVLVLARMTANKGYHYLISAAPAILARFSKVRFAFAGVPEERTIIERQIAATNLTPAFSILGFRTDTVNLLRSSDLFVLPSLGEGFSLSIIEALAAGLPVIATRVGGAAEIIDEGRNGFLVPPADAGALGEAVIRALSLDAPARENMRRAALDTARHFSFDITAQKMYEIYRSLNAGAA